MNIGIIVHSSTGNTLSVAEKIRDSLISAGHTATLERVTAMNEDPRAEGGSRLKDAPGTDSYDALIFGAPVWAFSLSSVMRAYLSQLPSLHGKKAGCFVTQHFPHAWMGGNHAVRQMETACEAKGAVIFETGVVNWSSQQREKQIVSLAEKMTQLSSRF